MIDSKRFSTLQALFAIEMIELRQIESDRGAPLFVATKWALCKHFDSLDEVATWYTRVTGKKASDVMDETA